MSRWAAPTAAVLAFASAAVTAYWLAGGTAGLDTVGGEVERLARERSSGAVAGLALTLLLKLAAGFLALALSGPRPARALVMLALVAGVGLALYGGVLVLAGALALAGVAGEPSDEYALRWHVFFWDPWFVVWGVALAVAAWRVRSRPRSGSRPAPR